MHKQYDLKLFSGAVIQLKHCNTNEYLFSNQIKLTTGQNILQSRSKKTMLGCTKNTLQEGTKFQIHLAYNDFGDMSDQPIKFGDLVYITQFDNIIEINMNNKAQTTNQKEAILETKNKDIKGSQIFVITPPEVGPDNVGKIQNSHIESGWTVRFLNPVSTFSLHSHPNFYKQKDLSEYREVTGFCERDMNDDWLIYIHELNYIKGLVQPQPRFKKEIHHGDSIIIRNAFLGTTLHSHSIQNKFKQQEVTTSLGLPRDRNDLWQIALYKNEGKRKTEIVNDLQYHSQICLIHVNTNLMLTNLFGSLNPDKTLQVCCTEEPLKFEEWTLMPISQQQIGLVYCNEFFLIKHNPTQQYLTSVQQPSYPTKLQYQTFLQTQPTNSSVWTIETTLLE